MKPGRGIIALLAGSVLLSAAYMGLGEQLREVETLAVERGDLELVIRVTGEVINDRQVEITALVDGQVNRVATTLGARVGAEEILATMDNRAAAASRQRAKAYLQQQDVHRREQLMRYRRLQKLAAKGAVSTEKLDAAKLNWEAASAAWEVAKADLNLAEVAQEWQQVRAPFDAVVIGKSTEVGQWVEAGTKLFTLVALERWEIEAHVDAVDSGRVKKGQPVVVRCDAFPGREWRSTISWIGPSVEREKDKRLNTFRVRIALGEESPPLLLGQQVDLEIAVERRLGVLRLPFAALQERDEQVEVALIEAGRVQYHTIETGLEGDTHVEVREGLEEGMSVVRLDGQALDPGLRVTAGIAP
ncbi:MAG: efflux RND transporter periplasmic adaptor subunit [Candidatus Thiodiazotropha sp. (ex. Lucinisca nassula)]|nr:efflux RND transporter periplasmic adaptor subunit [Candidatus Thiodiazotropha sp. (ex. Lucinisca nassula)]MBW9275460.1 efflux RND transporter periplasmic adaptor subunit [Candidatus Thiodiazotropha sp. (ex. Lucinisca nassula)]